MNISMAGVLIDNETLRLIANLDDEGKLKAINDIIGYYLEDKPLRNELLKDRTLDTDFMNLVHKFSRELRSK